MSLSTPGNQVQKLQTALQAKAKANPNFRFYVLWDKVYRSDVLREAWRLCSSKRGAAGVDGQKIDDIRSQGVEEWLGNLQQELRAGTYRPQSLLRVWIPKQNDELRPLSIPTVRDRVVQSAMMLVLGPIFEPDLQPEQYGFRAGKGAKDALRHTHRLVHQEGRREVVDADLSSYFTSIPHGALMKCLARRVVDKQVLQVTKAWLEAPVVERTRRGQKRTREAKRTHRGTPQGGVISPLLANLYFRRFLLAWKRTSCFRADGSQVVNYADDLVICCRDGNGSMAMMTMRKLMTKLGLEVNETKSHIARLPEESFDFLGYTIKRLYRRDGTAYIGTIPSMKSRKRLTRILREQTSTRHLQTMPREKVSYLNRIYRGWCNYFDLGPVWPIYGAFNNYLGRRLRRWLQKKHRRRGDGYRQVPNEYLHEELGLYYPRPPRWRQLNAKA